MDWFAGALVRRTGKEAVMGRTPEDERRSGIRWLIASVFTLALMLGMWWLVESTNREGQHDAQLLPYFTLIPLLIGLYHVARARARHAR